MMQNPNSSLYALRKSIISNLIDTSTMTNSGKITKLKKGDLVFKECDEFHYIYILLSGSIKTFTTINSGTEKITCFYYQDDIVGFSGIDTGRYPVSAKALEASSVFRIRFNDIEKLTDKHPNLQNNMLRLMSRQIHENQNLLSLLGKTQSEKKVASFLFNIYIQSCHSSTFTTLKLPMSRRDIGNYLGITEETVSRSITKLSQNNLIAISGKKFNIVDKMKLVELIDGHPV
ncbi:cyclic nucleotide-binding domain-containing protein [Marinomonas algarum]|uniref:Helix-turn-helix domain-containing protein n=1 Tax=Marinomonas algarum TaxID=2883105 RepID=A0A9X1IP10_9GAMM|nr:cyclic nucleotide-binding domain-containing protein [Marinomonas algarum]MCB5161288.1 helix-turn-helix domain-containing protein [Marinomonas algarum]